MESRKGKRARKGRPSRALFFGVQGRCGRPLRDQACSGRTEMSPSARDFIAATAAIEAAAVVK